MKYISDNIKDLIEPYLIIQQHVNDVGIFTTPAFKKEFGRYYKIIQKTNAWLSSYYKVFRNAYNYKWPFRKILLELYKETGEMHPVHCSEILASINPDKPIMQNYVYEWLGILIQNPKDKEERIDYYVNLYNFIDREFHSHLNDKNVIDAIKRFDEEFPNASEISNIKKLDFMLMSLKDERRISIFDYYKLLDELNKKG